MSRLLEVTDLTVTFPTDADSVHAVRGLNFHVDTGEVVALVGESGAGKSASAMAVVGLLPEFAEVSGSILLRGEQLLGRSDQEMSRVRGDAIGTVFQDPMSALTPVYPIGDQIAEAIEIHHPELARRAARSRAVELLELVGIAQPEHRARAFPHELSGGERQRVVIAIAIASNPEAKVLGMVSYAWAGFGAAFGPVIILSLFWERMTRGGALAGIVVGAVTVLVWKQGGWLGLYEIVPGFILGWLAVVVTSLLGTPPSHSMRKAHAAVQQEFARIGAR